MKCARTSPLEGLASLVSVLSTRSSMVIQEFVICFVY